jgi:hypothetical protein
LLAGDREGGAERILGFRWVGIWQPIGHMAGRLAFFGEIEGLGRRQAFTAHLAPLHKK